MISSTRKIKAVFLDLALLDLLLDDLTLPTMRFMPMIGDVQNVTEVLLGYKLIFME